MPNTVCPAAPRVLEATLQKVDAVLECERRGLRDAVFKAIGVQPEQQQQRQQVDPRLEDQVLRLAAEVGSLTSQVRAARQDSDNLRERIQVLESPVAAQAVFSSEIPKQMTEELLDVATAHITDRFTGLQDRVEKALLLWRKVDLKLLTELRTDVDHLRNKSPVDHGYSKMVDKAFAAVFAEADDPGLTEGAVVPVVTASPKDVEVLQQQIKEQVSETEVLTESMAQCNEKQVAMEKCMVALGQEWRKRLFALTSKVESSMSLLENARNMYSGAVDDKYSKQPSVHRIASCRSDVLRQFSQESRPEAVTAPVTPGAYPKSAKESRPEAVTAAPVTPGAYPKAVTPVLRSRVAQQSSQEPEVVLASPIVRCRSTGGSLTLPMPAKNVGRTLSIPALALNSIGAGGSLTLPSGASTERGCRLNSVSAGGSLTEPSGASTERGCRLGSHTARRQSSPTSSSMSPLPQMRCIVTRGGVGNTY